MAKEKQQKTVKAILHSAALRNRYGAERGEAVDVPVTEIRGPLAAGAAVLAKGETLETATRGPKETGATRKSGPASDHGKPEGPQLPEGYTSRHVAGGYYEVKDPEGNAVEGPSNGKWQGEDGAIAGAIAHAEAAEEEEGGTEAEEEEEGGTEGED